MRRKLRSSIAREDIYSVARVVTRDRFLTAPVRAARSSRRHSHSVPVRSLSGACMSPGPLGTLGPPGPPGPSGQSELSVQLGQLGQLK